MPEDVTKEIAATSEPPGGRRWRLRLASQEFFFLLQRIDRLDEKLSGEIKAQGEHIDRLDEKLTGEVKTVAGDLKDLDERVNARIDRLDEKLTREIKTLDEKLSGEIKTQDEKINALSEKINNKFNNLTFWSVGILVTIITGFLALLFH